MNVVWPEPMGRKKEQLFYEALQGSNQVDGLDLKTNAALAAPSVPSFLSIPFSKAWALCAADSILFAILKKYRDGNAQSKLSDLPLIVRTMVAVAIASSKSKVVVFSTAGLDPTGENRVLEYVNAKAKEGWSFILMNFPRMGEVPKSDVEIRIAEPPPQK